MIWLLSFAACAVVGLLLFRLYQSSASAEVARAEAVVARDCDMIRDRYAFYVAGWSGSLSAEQTLALGRDLGGVVAAALWGQAGVQGGIWRVSQGSLAYAYPSYAARGVSARLSTDHSEHVREASEAAANNDQPVLRSFHSDNRTWLLAACPLGGPIAGLAAWTLSSADAKSGFDPFRVGLGVLFGLMLALTAALARVLGSWSRALARVQTALTARSDDALPPLEPTGERELDRLVGLLNETGERLIEARHRSQALAARVASAERLAALGRMTAGMAHEIRNPIAAIRLKAENALDANDARRRAALQTVLEQVQRLERLVSEMLAATQRREPEPRDVDLATFARSCAARFEDRAAAADISLAFGANADSARFDPELIGRAIDNLVLNALQQTGAGGEVRMTIKGSGERLRFVVEDSGPGVAPELRGRLFEPFATGRADGTGLGLAIARELAEAHGGTLELLPHTAPERGAAFLLELPWRQS